MRNMDCGWLRWGARQALLAVVLLCAMIGRGQEAPTNAVAGTNPPAISAAAEKTWAFNLSVAGYLVPEDRDYAQPTLMADHDWLHLEARYNYEAFDTGSLWVGYNLGGEVKLSRREDAGELSKLQWQLTPMVGGVFGHQNGVAPGYSGLVGWWKLELYSQGEYVFDAGDKWDSFFYSWSELSISPMDWWRVGLVAQRTRAYQSEVDIQRGLLLGVKLQSVSFTAYFFNLDQRQQTYVLSVGWNF